MKCRGLLGGRRWECRLFNRAFRWTNQMASSTSWASSTTCLPLSAGHLCWLRLHSVAAAVCFPPRAVHPLRGVSAPWCLFHSSTSGFSWCFYPKRRRLTVTWQWALIPGLQSSAALLLTCILHRLSISCKEVSQFDTLWYYKCNRNVNSNNSRVSIYCTTVDALLPL